MSAYNICGDDWLTDGDGGRLSIMLPSIESAMNLLGVTDSRERLELAGEVKLVGRTMVREWNKKRKEKKGA